MSGWYINKYILKAWSELPVLHAEHLRKTNKTKQTPKKTPLHDKTASAYLDTRENASEQMAGQGTSLMAMCPRAAG